jgi:YegS/Rv2252/BmrU family lipid kinase
MKRLFIINPKSGTARDGDNLRFSINKHFPCADIIFTKRKGHAKELAANAVAQGYNQVIVSGGDGTINEVVQSLAGSETALGVIARGSGNGLARELGCPLDNYDLACKTILNAYEVRCDLGRANGEYFANLAGIGFEADIAFKFDRAAKSGKRGKLPYFTIGLKEFSSFKPPRVKVIYETGEEAVFFPLTMVFANGRQYGTNFKIAPHADLSDGLLDMVVVNNAGFFRLLLGFVNFFAEGLAPVKLTSARKVKKAVLNIEGPFYYHIDGEPRETRDSLTIEIMPGALKILMA